MPDTFAGQLRRASGNRLGQSPGRAGNERPSRGLTLRQAAPPHMKYRVFISRHTAGLDDLTRREQKDEEKVLRRLHEIKQFSVFEATDNPVIAGMMDWLLKAGHIEITPKGFPWSDVKLTESGLKRAGLNQ